MVLLEGFHCQLLWRNESVDVLDNYLMLINHCQLPWRNESVDVLDNYLMFKVGRDASLKYLLFQANLVNSRICIVNIARK